MWSYTVLAIVCIHKISYVQRTSSNFHIWCQRNFDRQYSVYYHYESFTWTYSWVKLRDEEKMLEIIENQIACFSFGMFETFQILNFPVKKNRERMYGCPLVPKGLLLGPLQSVRRPESTDAHVLSFIFLFWNFRKFCFPFLECCQSAVDDMWNMGDLEAWLF